MAETQQKPLEAGAVYVQKALSNKEFLQESPDVQIQVLSRLSPSFGQLENEAKLSVLQRARNDAGLEQPQTQAPELQPEAPQDLGFFQTALNKGVETATLGLADMPESSNQAGNLVGGFGGSVIPVGLGTLLGGLPGGVAAAGAVGLGTDAREQLNQGAQNVNWLQSAISGLGGAGGQFLGGKFGTTLLKDALINAGTNAATDMGIQGFNNNGQVDLMQSLGAALQGVGGAVAGRAVPQLGGGLGKITNDFMGLVGLRENKAQPVGLAGLERLAKQQEMARQGIPQQQAAPLPQQRPTALQQQQLNEQGALPAPPASPLDRIMAIKNPGVRLSALKQREAMASRKLKRAKQPEAQVEKEAELKSLQKAIIEAKQQKVAYDKQLENELEQNALKAKIQAYGAPITKPDRLLPSPQAVKQQRNKEFVQQVAEQRFSNAKQRAKGAELPSSGEVIPMGKPLKTARPATFEESINQRRKQAVELGNPKLTQKDLGKIEAELEQNVRNQVERPASLRLLAEVQKQRAELRKQEKAAYLGKKQPLNDEDFEPVKAKPAELKQQAEPVQKTQELTLDSYKARDGTSEKRFNIKQKQPDGSVKTIAKAIDEKTAKAYAKKGEVFARIEKAAEAAKAPEFNDTPEGRAKKAELFREFVPKEALKYFNSAARAMEKGHMINEGYVAEKVGASEGVPLFEKGLTTPIDFELNPKTGDVRLRVIDEQGQLKSRLFKEGGQGFYERGGLLRPVDKSTLISEYTELANTKTVSPYRLERRQLTQEQLEAKGANYKGDGYQTVVVDELGNIIEQKKVKSTPVSETIKAFVESLKEGGTVKLSNLTKALTENDKAAILLDAPPRVRKYLKKALTDKDCC